MAILGSSVLFPGLNPNFLASLSLPIFFSPLSEYKHLVYNNFSKRGKDHTSRRERDMTYAYC